MEERECWIVTLTDRVDDTEGIDGEYFLEVFPRVFRRCELFLWVRLDNISTRRGKP